MSNFKDRLVWLKAELDKLHGNGWVRYEGDSVFYGAKAELENMIETYQEPEPVAPVVEQVVMTAEQVAEVIRSIPKVGNYESVLAGLTVAVHDALEVSDVAVMAAINAKGDDIIAALPKAA